ncbi:hypothetical protein AB0I49_23240 [Streptomyces sp. NPDC050617]|uniref:hypothetical protein n=1 Tax=Streptomyces sp. NPDC050617 TaxID=3154628 RepID=UPI003441A99F
MPATHDLSAQDLALLAGRAGLPLPADRLPLVTATVNGIHQVVSVLRDIPLGDTAPAFPPAPAAVTTPGHAPAP